MSVASVDSVERSVHKTNEWINELAEELGIDKEDAWRLLRAYLQVLRDRLTVEEASELASQLPHVLRGAFYDGFVPHRQPVKLRTRGEFLEHFAERAQLEDREEAERAVQAATHVLRRHISEGEFDDVLSQLPSEVREVLQHA